MNGIVESNSVIFAGPFLGEFGWELSHWAPHVRWLRKQYSGKQLIVASYPGRQSLYHQFVDDFWALPDWFVDTHYDCDCFEALCGSRIQAKLMDYYKNQLAKFFLPQNVIWTKPPRGFNKILREMNHVHFDKLTPSVTGDTIATKIIQEHKNKPIVIIFARAMQRETFLNIQTNQINFCEDFKEALPSNNWPRSHWEDLFDMLYKQYSKQITFVIGGTKGGNCLLNVSKTYRDVIDLTQYDSNRSLDITIAMLNKALCSISSQSGPTHLSVQCGCPSFIYGHEQQRCAIDDNPLGTDVVFLETKIGMYNDLPEVFYKDAAIYIKQLLGEKLGRETFDTGNGELEHMDELVRTGKMKVIDPEVFYKDAAIDNELKANEFMNTKGEVFIYSPESYSEKSEDWIKNITSEQTLLDKYADPWHQGYINRWKNWFANIEINGRILDIGFQNGNTLYQFSQKYPNIKIDALDFNPGLLNAIPFYKKLMPNLDDIWIGECQSINKPDKYYDYISALDFFEHLPENIYFKTIQECYRLLKNGGHIFVYVGKSGATAHINERPDEQVIKDMQYYGFEKIQNIQGMFVFRKQNKNMENKPVRFAKPKKTIKKIGMVGVFDVNGSTNRPLGQAFVNDNRDVDVFNYRTVANEIGHDAMNKEIVKFAMNYDMIVFCKCNGVTAATIKECSQYAITVWYMMDALVHLQSDANYYDMAKAADINIVTTKAVHDELTNIHNLKNVYHVLQGVSPKEFHPISEKIEKQYDVVFIGQRTKKRDKYIDIISKSGFTVKAHGPGYGDEVYGNDFNIACAKGRILLAINNTEPGLDGFSDRILRYMATGGCVLTEYSKGLEQYFSPSHLFWFKTEERLILALQDAMLNEAITQSVAQRGYQHVIDNYTWDKVVEQIFQIVEKMEKDHDKNRKTDNLRI